MIEQRFLAIKADFIETYRPLLCDESMIDILNAMDWPSFVDVLRKYMVYNNYRPFPDVEWVRKWFSDHREELNDEGVYLDQCISLKDPERHVFLFGHCVAHIIYTLPRQFRILAQDESKVHAQAYGTSVVFVKLKGDASFWQIAKSLSSRIKIRHYENTDETQWR